jgi:TonB family protein
MSSSVPQRALLLLIVLAPLWLVLSFARAAPPQEYLAPTSVEAGDAFFPTTGPPVVAVSLLATVESDGHVSETQIIDSIGSTFSGEPYQGTLVGYVEDSVAAVKQWRFSPAIDPTFKRTRSAASITFVYDRVRDREPGTIPAMRTASPKAGQYLPPLARQVSRVEYPLRSYISTARPTVVLKLRIEADGSIAAPELVRSVPALDEPSVRAVRGFQFQPARIEGKPVRSTAIVAFVFLPPTVGH